MTSVLCGDFDTGKFHSEVISKNVWLNMISSFSDTDAKCAGIDVPESKDDVDDKSLAEAMKKIMDKIL